MEMRGRGVEWEVIIAGKRFPQYSSTVTLIKPREGVNLLFDLGSPYDNNLLLRVLQRHNLGPDDITHVLCSHWHIDHLGGIMLFPKAEIISSKETLKTQKELCAAVVEAEKKKNPVQELTRLLMEHILADSPFTGGNLRKFHAMANITIRNAIYLKEFIRKYEDDKIFVVDQSETTLFGSLKIFKVGYHTEGDLIATFTDSKGKEVFVVGDVVTGIGDSEDEQVWMYRLKRKDREKKVLIVPGHGNVFSVR